MRKRINFLNTKLLAYSMVFCLCFFSCQEAEIEKTDEIFELDHIAGRRPGGGSSGSGSSGMVTRSITVLTQNVGWLPGLGVLGDGVRNWLDFLDIVPAGFRSNWQAMANYLIAQNADIVVIQEGFVKEELKLFSEVMDNYYPYYTSLDESDFSTIDALTAADNGHGIVIFSKYPIEAEWHHYFGFNTCLNEDCWANKGFVVVKINIGLGRRAYVLGTHLQAGGGEPGDIIRDAQIEQIAQSISSYYNRNYPMILAGDFNLNFLNNEDFAILSQLESTAIIDVGSTGTNTNGQSIIDLIMNKNSHPQPTSASAIVDRAPIDNEITDHASVKAYLTYSLHDACYQVSCPTGWSCVSGTCVEGPDQENDDIWQ